MSTIHSAGNRRRLSGSLVKIGGMSERPSFIRHWSQFESHSGFTYPGDTETFGSYVRLSRDMGFKKVAVSYENLPPGKRSSWPHAHSIEEEMIIILEGNPEVWIDGVVHALAPGDVVGFPAGTGIAHCIINNSDRDAKMIVVGEIDPPVDRLFYPKHPHREAELRAKALFWEGHPKREMGPHNGKPADL